MKHYSQAAVERTMKVQEVIMRAMARKIAQSNQQIETGSPSQIISDRF
jgi:hypothetical protein